MTLIFSVDKCGYIEEFDRVQAATTPAIALAAVSAAKADAMITLHDGVAGFFDVPQSQNKSNSKQKKIERHIYTFFILNWIKKELKKK